MWRVCGMIWIEWLGVTDFAQLGGYIFCEKVFSLQMTLKLWWVQKFYETKTIWNTISCLEILIKRIWFRFNIFVKFWCTVPQKNNEIFFSNHLIFKKNHDCNRIGLVQNAFKNTFFIHIFVILFRKIMFI